MPARHGTPGVEEAEATGENEIETAPMVINTNNIKEDFTRRIPEQAKVKCGFSSSC
jgi:hypothetical protein